MDRTVTTRKGTYPLGKIIFGCSGTNVFIGVVLVVLLYGFSGKLPNKFSIKSFYTDIGGTYVE